MSAAELAGGFFVGFLVWWALWRGMQNDYTARGAIYTLAILLIGTSAAILLEHGVNGYTAAAAVGLLGIALFALALCWSRLETSSLVGSITNVASNFRFWLAIIAAVWVYGAATSVVLLAQRSELEKIVREDIVPFRMALERWVIPRHLSPEQKETIGNYLSKFRSHTVAFTVTRNDEEADSYRNDLQEALVNGGWIVSGRSNADDVKEGLTIRFDQTFATSQLRDDPRTPEQDRLLQEALRKAGVEIDGGGGQSGESIKENILTIHIGHRRRDRLSALQHWPF